MRKSEKNLKLEKLDILMKKQIILEKNASILLKGIFSIVGEP